MKTKKNKKSGFTLVELMIVAAIIAILAAIIIPLLASNKDRAVAAEGQNLCGTIATAAKVYYAEHGTIPAYTDLPQLTRDEIGRAKYFSGTPPTIGGTGLSDLTVTVTANANAGTTLSGGTITLYTATTAAADIWQGSIATALSL